MCVIAYEMRCVSIQRTEQKHYVIRINGVMAEVKEYDGYHLAELRELPQ